MSDRILVIDDSPDIHALVKVRLGKEDVVVFSAHDGASGIEAARTLRPDLILLDIEMPEQDGFSVCAELKGHPDTLGIPIIFLTGAATTEDKIRGLELGATDYVTKPFDPAELRARVRATLRTKSLLDLLSRKAMIDGLTGLWNRAYLDASLLVCLSTARRHGRPLSCIMADVDHFKSINDRFGHGFGDDVLRAIAALLIQHCRAEDIPCRYGGEEFVILLPDTTLDDAAAIAERLRQSIESSSLAYHDMRVKITCSFGVAHPGQDMPPSLIELADEALYKAKHSGRNRVEMQRSSPELPSTIVPEPGPFARLAALKERSVTC